jgi:hypothetical protein
MFDDHTPQGGGAVPPNLPLGEPEDIFAAVEPESELPESPSPSEVVTPPLADAAPPPPVKTALSAGALKPKVEGSLPPTPAPAPATDIFDKPAPVPMAPAPAAPQPSTPTHTLPTDVPEMYAIKEPKASKGIITGIIVIVVVLVLGGGGVFVYNQFIANPGSPDISVDFDATVEGDNTDTDTGFFEEIDTDIPDTEDTLKDTDNNTTSSDTISEAESDILFGEPIDTDADGLDDEREADLGTDEAHWDTDGDELSDGDEVIIWKTDPLNPDSDEDGFNDGAEIKNGYSPTGQGKIFEPPAELSDV